MERRTEASSKGVFFISLFAFLFISVQLISSSNVIHDIKYVATKSKSFDKTDIGIIASQWDDESNDAINIGSQGDDEKNDTTDIIASQGGDEDETDIIASQGGDEDETDIIASQGGDEDETDIIASQGGDEDETHAKQRICIIAGPHKTGTSSIETNMWRWSRPTYSYEFSSSKYPPLKQHVIEWIWPIPAEIAKWEQSDTTAWDWTPAKVYYPMVEALYYHKRKVQPRSVFHRYQPSAVVDMYRNEIEEYWSKGHNIVFGTEAMDTIVKVPQNHGALLTKNFSAGILPSGVKGSQVTVMVAYRTPKIKHLISVWHQNCVRKTDPDFFEWITTTKNTLGSLDSLGMVELFLENTDWNIALVDLQGLSDDGWDPSNFFACEILGEECEERTPLQLLKSAAEPVVANVRSAQRPPNVPDETLDEMEELLLNYDCGYLIRMEEWIDDTAPSRVTLYHPEGIKRTIVYCQMLNKKQYILSRPVLKKKIVRTALSHGSIEIEWEPEESK